MQYLSVDNVQYRVRVVYGSLTRAFEIVEGPNSGTAITARNIRDILGTGYSYAMTVEPDMRYPTDYDAFYNAITAPVDSHVIRMPYGQTELEFEAMIESGEDSLGANVGGYAHWHSLNVTFKPIKPQKVI